MRRVIVVIGLLLFHLFLASSQVEAADNPHQDLGNSTLLCGAEPRPGFADADSEGRIVGLAVDLCRAVAMALRGPDAPVVFRLYDSDREFDQVRKGRDNLAFLTNESIRDHDLREALQPGPVVFQDPLGVMVSETSSVHSLSDLEGRTICFMIASPAQRALERFASDHNLHFARLAFQEDVEMVDAYNVQRCEAAVGESTYLATMRATPGVKHLASRLLPTPLALNDVVVATDIHEKVWSPLVFEIVRAIITGRDSPDLNLRPGWRSQMLSALGDYQAMQQRNVVDRLGLAPRLNVPWPKVERFAAPATINP
jgi:general L-amino acid transport system substrate-binding protein